MIVCMGTICKLLTNKTIVYGILLDFLAFLNFVEKLYFLVDLVDDAAGEAVEERVERPVLTQHLLEPDRTHKRRENHRHQHQPAEDFLAWEIEPVG